MLRIIKSPSSLKQLLLLLGFGILGYASIFVSESFSVSLILAGILASCILFFINLQRELDPADRGFLVKLALIAFLVRLSTILAIHLFIPTLEVPDGIHYSTDSQILAEAWKQQGWIAYGDIIQFPLQAYGYIYYNTAIYFLLGSSVLYPQIINSFLAVLSIIYTFKLAKTFFSGRVARFAAVCTGFMPSIIWWTSQNLKDSAVVFLSLLCLWFASQGLLYWWRNIPLLGGGLLLLLTIRQETAIALTVMIAITLVFQRTHHHINRVIVTNIGIVIIGLTTLSLGQGFLGIDFLEKRLTPESITEIRQRTALGGSSVETGEDSKSLAGFIAYMPIALTNFLLRPYPWEATGSLTQIMTIPESFIWYPLFGFTIFGLITSIRLTQLHRSLLWSYTIMATLAAAPHYGNLGTAYRHRVQLWPLFFIFAAVGWYRWRELVNAKHNPLTINRSYETSNKF